MKLTPSAAIEWFGKNTLQQDESFSVLITKNQRDELSSAIHKASPNGKYLGRHALELANEQLVALFAALAKGNYELSLVEDFALVEGEGSSYSIRVASRKTAQDAPNGSGRRGNPSRPGKASLQRHCNANSAGRASRRVPVSSFARR